MALDEQYGEEILDFVRKQDGYASYNELVQLLGVSEADVDRLLLDLVESGKIEATRAADYKRFYTSQALARKQKELLGAVEAHGEIRMADLARMLNAPEGLIKEWIYALVEAQKFSGYIDWGAGLLYSKAAEVLRQAGRCPNCGGKLGMAGKGIIHCENCGSEIFL
jgi:DNA-binding Lrp family transcriptional regulator